MGGKRIRSAPRVNKSKRKKWKKGHSSNSNPEARRFREAAKHRFFSPKSGPSKLTVEALSKHDESQGGLDQDGDVVLSEIDAQSTSAKTFNTWATNWTECTNATFSRVHRYWSSNSAMHKEILAVLAAVTEVIKQQGGKENETEYFAALMTALETAETEDSLAAIAYLLNLATKRVPVPVLRSRFSQVAKQLLDILAKHSDGESTSLLKSLLLCLAAVLRVQEPAVWNNSSTQQIYTGLLTFIIHRKPKVRKAAQQAVRIVLKGSVFMIQGDPPPHHPAASLTAKYCIHQIEECGGVGEAVQTLHTLALLRDILGVFPQNSVKSVCETILRVMTVSNVMVRACGMQTLHGLFSSRAKATSLPADLNAQIITALYDYQPSENDSQPMQAWMAVMEQAHINLHRLDVKLCISHLPKLFSSGMTCLLSDRQEVARSATASMKLVLQECVLPESESLGELVKSAPEGSQTPVHKILKALESGLSYQFHASWGLVLELWGVFFESLGRHCPQLMKKCLLSMADLRETHKFSFRLELDKAMGSAVKFMAPHHVLEAVPLNISGQGDDLDFPRSWLVPIIRDNVEQTELGFFTSYFLPLAAKFRQKAQECAEEQSVVASKAYDALQQQIWSLLPGFCKNPTDLAQSFKGIAKVLGSAISDRPDLRMKVMSSLRSLISLNLDNETNKAELARFGKNFLPILFNLYTTDPESEKDTTRLAVLETIKVYLQIIDKELIRSFFDKCMEKLKEETTSSFKTNALIDLEIGMLPYIDRERLKLMFDLALPNLSSLDRGLQKKSYRIMEEICAGKSEDRREFTKHYLSDLQNMLLASLSKSSPSSKAPRLRCLIHIFQQLEDRQMGFFLAVLPEAILCTKEIGERARLAAYNLLIVMAEANIRWNKDKSEAESLTDFFKMLLAGLVGSPQMISGTLLALTRVLYTYTDKVSTDLLESLVENVCILLTSKTREVVKSALGFVKLLLSAYQDTTLAGQLKRLVSGLVSMKDDCRHHFHQKTKQIYGKLIRKFGYENIHGMIPASYHKVLNNIRKTQERTKRKNKATKEDSEDEVEEHKPRPESIDDLLRDTDSEVEEEDRKKKPQKIKKKGKKTWLEEANEDHIIDFLDPEAAKKVLATKPSNADSVVKKRKTEFKMAADGRFIITGEENKGEKLDSGDEDELDELLDALEGGAKKKRSKKRKLEDFNSDEEGESALKYKAGGSGIHRPIAKAKHSQQTKKTDHGAAYRAKKAGGDIKKKGKPDPYAYVPLNFQSLNKRKQARMKGQFSNFVKGAKKGAAKGRKGAVKGRKKKH